MTEKRQLRKAPRKGAVEKRCKKKVKEKERRKEEEEKEKEKEEREKKEEEGKEEEGKMLECFHHKLLSFPPQKEYPRRLHVPSYTRVKKWLSN